MRRMKRVVATALIAVTAFSCCAGTIVIPWNGDVVAVAEAKTKTQTINLVKGDTYKIKIKKNSIIKLSKKKIVSVSKKGKIKALKAGKCKVTIKKGKKTWKYNVVVRKKSDKKIIPTPVPTMVPTVSPTAAPGGYEILSGFIVDRIEKFKDIYSYVYLTDDPDIEGTSMPNDQAVKYVRITVSEKMLKDICAGCGVSILKYHPSQKKIEGDICSYDGINDIRLDKKEVNAPTVKPKPTFCSHRQGGFSILQEEITTETKYLTFETFFPKRELIFYVEVDGKRFENVYKKEGGGVGEYIFPIDFSAFESGSNIKVGIQSYSYTIEDDEAYHYYSMYYRPKEFLLDGKPKITADTWLSFNVKFYTTVLPRIAKDISGKVKYNESMDTIIEIEVNGNVIASKELKAGEESFSIPVDLSEYKAGDKLHVTYSCAEGNVEVYETDENFVHHIFWPAMMEFEIVE